VHQRLTSLAPRLRISAPIAITVAAVLTAGTAASAVTLRLSDAQPHHVPAVQHVTQPVAVSKLKLPPAPAPAGVAPSHSAIPLSTARVPRPHKLVEATVLVTASRALPKSTLHSIRHVSGVTAIQTVAAARTNIDGHQAFTLGVIPASFRPWTPNLTAASQALWQSIARGELTASFDMGHQAKLPLSETVAVRDRHRIPVRIGAFASVGMAGVDAVVSRARALQLGMTDGTGVIVSAPHADALAVRRAIDAVVSGKHHTSLLREVVVIRDAGEFLTRLQINTMLRAAASRVGTPYVWGAEGPNSFDCSGLVQWSFARAGIGMPRVSQQQWLAGPHISYASARPGDLLFWHYDPTDISDIDHVAIYAGNGMMLVAPHTGLDVEYVPVAMNSSFAGVVRVDPGIAAEIG